MTDEELLSELRRWGQFRTLAEETRQHVAPNPRAHVIERTRRFAPLTIKKAKRKLMGRDGESRRRIVAKAASVKGMTIVPMWSCDPIPCKDTRGGGGGGSGGTQVLMPPELNWVDRALRDMAGESPVRAMIVRVEFTDTRPQKTRAMHAQKLYGGSLTFWQYRKELERALSWLIGWHCAKAA